MASLKIGDGLAAFLGLLSGFLMAEATVGKNAKRGKNCSPSLFSCLDWLSYHLCALHALLTGRLSLSDVLELAILWARLAG